MPANPEINTPEEGWGRILFSFSFCITADGTQFVKKELTQTLPTDPKRAQIKVGDTTPLSSRPPLFLSPALSHRRPKELLVHCLNRCLHHGLGCHVPVLDVIGPRPQSHVNFLKLLAIHLALHHFRALLRGKHVLVQTDNSATVAYMNCQGGLHFSHM